MKRNRIGLLFILLACPFFLLAQLMKESPFWPTVNIATEIEGGWDYEGTSYGLHFYRHCLWRDNQMWPYERIARKGDTILLSINFRGVLCELELIPQGYDFLKIRCQMGFFFLPAGVLEEEFITLKRLNPGPMTPREFRERAINYSSTTSSRLPSGYHENINIPQRILSEDWVKNAEQLRLFPSTLLGYWQEIKKGEEDHTGIVAFFPRGILTAQSERSMYPVHYSELFRLYKFQNIYALSTRMENYPSEGEMWLKYQNDTLTIHNISWGGDFGNASRIFIRKNRLKSTSLPTSLQKKYSEFREGFIPEVSTIDPPENVQIVGDQLIYSGHRLTITNVYKNENRYALNGPNKVNYDVFAVDPKTQKEYFFALLFNQKKGSYFLYAFGIHMQAGDGTLHIYPWVFEISGGLYTARQVIQIVVGILTPVLFILALLFLRNRRIRRQRQQAQLALRGIRAQLNPHFLFNALASIQSLVNRNDQEGANRYLSGFSKLLRHTLYHSEQDYISLEEELAHLRQYCELEALRSPFEYTIKVAENLDVFNTEIPSMLLQPYVENAILHGLREHPGQPKLEVWIHQQGKNLRCEITDNGQGIKANQEQKKGTAEFGPKLHGMGLSAERIRLLNLRLRKKITLEVVDRLQKEQQSGTRIIINIPQ